jgi:L-lactate dehydrogenase
LALDNFAHQVKHPMTARTRDTITYRVKNAAYDILQGRGATWDGIGAAVADLVRAIVNNERRILTVSTVASKFLPKPVALSLPRVVGENGATVSLRPDMTADESRGLRASAVVIRKNFEHIERGKACNVKSS